MKASLLVCVMNKCIIDSKEAKDLYKSIRSRRDILSWRTFVIEIKKILGSKNPEFEPFPNSKLNKAENFVCWLVKNSLLEDMQPEILFALGFDIKFDKKRMIDVLIFNAHHEPEPILWKLADSSKREGKKVALVNPVGHYNDMQTRILSPCCLFAKVEKLLIVSSTQEMYGGSIRTLANVIRTVRNLKFAQHIKEIDVVIPMFGGSRGHRLGQGEEVGYEVMEAVFNAKVLALTTKDVLEQLRVESVGKQVPLVRFFSVDIHNSEYPFKTFKNEGFEFISINPAEQIANIVYDLVREKKLIKYKLKIVACDRGARPRTEKLAYELITNPDNTIEQLDVVYFVKKRKQAGIVESVRLDKLVRWKILNGKIIKESADMRKDRKDEKCVLIYSDDMIDTGGTAAKDIEFLKTYYPNIQFSIFAATHPVLSKSTKVLDAINANMFLVGNTLDPRGLKNHSKVKIVDVSEAIINGIFDKI
jgi:phosphoribosylpyrophosphate synthetase